MGEEKYLITGASGFIGSKIFNNVINNKLSCIGVGRRQIKHQNYAQCDLFDLDRLRVLLNGVTCIIHCAGYAHAFQSKSSEIYEKTWLVNYQGTKNLLELSVEMGVKKFINLSTVKVMSEPGSNFANEEWGLCPNSEYGKSKLAAEKIIFEIAKSNDIIPVNLRLSMVYGFGGKGNLERMCKLIHKHIFPPIPETNNLRSLVHVDDVVDAVMCVVNDSRAHGQTYIITGPRAYSGREIYNEVRKIYGYKPISFEVSLNLMKFLAEIFQLVENKLGVKVGFNKEMLSRIVDSECYSSMKIQKNIGWSPQIYLESGLREMLDVR